MVFSIDTIITKHFEVFFWYVADKPFDEVHGRYSFYHIFFVFMPIVMKSNEFTIVLIDSGSGVTKRKPQPLMNEGQGS